MKRSLQSPEIPLRGNALRAAAAMDRKWQEWRALQELPNLLKHGEYHHRGAGAATVFENHPVSLDAIHAHRPMQGLRKNVGA